MGNAPSKTASGNAPQTASSSTAATPSHVRPANLNHSQQQQSSGRDKREPRRRESIHALSHKATATPSPVLESVTAQPASASSSQRSAKEALRSQSAQQQSQPSQTDTITTHFRAQDPAARMGNQESKPSEKREKAEKSTKVLSPKPIAIPPAAAAAQALEKTAQPPAASPLETLPVPEDDLDQLPPAEYNRPPRMPLPIEEEVYAPGSPIISTADLKDAVEPLGDGSIPRASSMLSSTTMDEEEDLGDDIDALGYGAHPGVNTVIEWKEKGEKVYVTGTFADWDRKFRLHKNGPSPDKEAFSAMICLQPGTHHLRFLVDGEMKVSSFLPTAVDFAGFLVNYIEVLPAPAQPPVPAGPSDVPTEDKQPLDHAAAQVEFRVPPGIHPPQALPPTPELIPVKKPPVATQPKDDSKGVKIVPGPEKQYHNEIPQFLLDLDAPEDSSRLARASAVTNTLPAPPSLPLFLGKSILNGTTQIKDDASVLVMPNHTVLNHLATSSIRDKVLATSATIRYKKKFLTTIMYKPTSETGD